MTLLDLAMRFVGEVREIPGKQNDPFIEWCHASTTMGEMPDEVPWCSSFVNRLAWMLRLPRSKSAAARSWLSVGIPTLVVNSEPGFDVVVLKRGSNPTQGHVGILAGYGPGNTIEILGGNQGNQVTVAPFPVPHVVGIRRLKEVP